MRAPPTDLVPLLTRNGKAQEKGAQRKGREGRSKHSKALVCLVALRRHNSPRSLVDRRHSSGGTATRLTQYVLRSTVYCWRKCTYANVQRRSPCKSKGIKYWRTVTTSPEGRYSCPGAIQGGAIAGPLLY